MRGSEARDIGTERPIRKLAAVLAADVVSYSRLMEADERRTLDRLKALRSDVLDPAVAEHGGRIVKATGDGLLCDFASAVDATQCALHVQSALAESEATSDAQEELKLRIGINLGDVIIEGDDLFGDGVNVAARLEGLAKPGGIAISAAVHEQVSGKIDAVFEDGGRHEVKNITRPIQVWSWSPGPRHKAIALPAASPESDTPSIAVIPFESFSSDPELEFLAIGMTEDIITLLARLPGFLVIARHSTMVYRGASRDVRDIGRELGVRYVVEGSIRRVGNLLRVSVQLIDAQSGNHLWAHRFDRPASEVAALHDEMTAGIVSHLQPELNRAEVQFVERYTPENITAWTLYQRAGDTLFSHGWNEASFAEAVALYRSAIDADENFALTRAALALTLAIGHVLGFVEDTDEAAREAEQAMRLSDNDSEVLGYAGCALSDLGEQDRGIAILQTAVEINPSNAQAWSALGTAHLIKGELADAAKYLEYGLRISPRDPRAAFWSSMLALARALAGDMEAAAEEARSACRRDHKLSSSRVVLAAILMMAGDEDGARTSLAEARRLKPKLSAREVRGLVGPIGFKALELVWE